MTYADWMLILAFTPIMSVGAAALFFGSDYAQKRWNADEYYKRTNEPRIVIECDYRTRIDT
ncbi:hypothetical protein [uncultured Castellaniella sp.]|uniref:hypothetical protein n=1 Tax=uncultured Castellaniella sp. TaxID=647907 RepID=UPI001A098106|nr:hypothetical protein [uncultured Castellaniella sp.]MBE0689448.1 hypothetical protein [Anaerolineae bacterium]